MILRIAARQRSILSYSYRFDVAKQKEYGWACLDGNVIAQISLCADCRRIYTQVIRGKPIPFFQRSITSTADRLNATAAPAIEQHSSSPLITTASSNQSTHSAIARLQRTKVNRSPTIWTYAELGKPRLSVLIALSTMSAYALAPYPASIPTLLFLSTGTYLCVTGANTFNMVA